MKIFLGPAGIPLCSKKRSTLEGLRVVKELGLNCMEVEFVRGVKMSKSLAKNVGEVAKSLNIQLSVHAPYFINLCSENEDKVESSKERILESLERADDMGAEIAVIHAAYYGNLTKEETFESVKRRLEEILEECEERGIEARIAVETMAKERQFGSFEEIVRLCKKLKGKILPLLDFMHIYVRNGGKIDYSKIFDELKPLNLAHIYSHFSGSKYNINTKKFMDVHVPMGQHPPFLPLAVEIVKRKVNITIISESPILEKDSLKMKKIFEELGYVE